jgi:hypothetical protein
MEIFEPQINDQHIMVGKDIEPDFGDTQICLGSPCNLRMCPNCARQGQTFPNETKSQLKKLNKID